MTTNLQLVLSLIPKLTKAELTMVRQACAMSIGQSRPEQSTDDEILLEAIASVLGRAGLEFCQPSMLRRAPQYSQFCDKVPAVMRFLHGCGMTKNERRAVLDIGVELLYQNLSQMGIAISARTLMSHIHRLPSVLNQAFPGYAQAGLLAMIVRTRKETQHVR